MKDYITELAEDIFKEFDYQMRELWWDKQKQKRLQRTVISMIKKWGKSNEKKDY